MSGAKSSIIERFTMEPQVAAAMSAAERQMGQLQMLGRVWPLWDDFVAGPLTAYAALNETAMRGLDIEPVELLALGPEPSPSRPGKPLRIAVGHTLALRKLDGKTKPALSPQTVGAILTGIDAPQFSRSQQREDWQLQNSPPGAAIWAQAGKLVSAGLPPLAAAGLALATWEREGPDHNRRSVTGRVLLCGLARYLGLPPAGFLNLGPALPEAAKKFPGGLQGLLSEVRSHGAWRPWLPVFLRAVEISAAQAANLALGVHMLQDENQGLVRTWVRAPRHPLRLLDLLAGRAVIDLPTVAKELDVTQRTAGLLSSKLEEMGLLVEVTGQKRGRRYAYIPLINTLWPAEDGED